MLRIFTDSVLIISNFRNNLAKKEYTAARGSALCHIATEHGRLLKAMIDDKEIDMTEEINALAKYNSQFNESYKTFLDNNDDGFVLPDDEIISR